MSKAKIKQLLLSGYRENIILAYTLNKDACKEVISKYLEIWRHCMDGEFCAPFLYLEMFIELMNKKSIDLSVNASSIKTHVRLQNEILQRVKTMPFLKEVTIPLSWNIFAKIVKNVGSLTTIKPHIRLLEKHGIEVFFNAKY